MPNRKLTKQTNPIGETAITMAETFARQLAVGVDVLKRQQLLGPNGVDVLQRHFKASGITRPVDPRSWDDLSALALGPLQLTHGEVDDRTPWQLEQLAVGWLLREGYHKRKVSREQFGDFDEAILLTARALTVIKRDPALTCGEFAKRLGLKNRQAVYRHPALKRVWDSRRL